MTCEVKQRQRLQLSENSSFTTSHRPCLRSGRGFAATLLCCAAVLLPRASCFDRNSAAYLQVPRQFEFPSNAQQCANSFSKVQRESFEAAFRRQSEHFGAFVKKAEGFVFGAVGGASGTAVIYPAEATKMRMQAATSRAAKGFFPTFFNTMRNEGAAGLYKGLKSTLVGVAPEKAIMIGMNQALRKATSSHQDSKGRLPLGLELLCGSLSGMGQVLFSSPKEMIMIQMQLASQRASAGAAAITSPLGIVRNLGVRGLYQGSVATALREVPFAAVYFTAYSQIKGSLLGSRDKLPLLETLGAATAAAAPAALLTMPADVLKTRMQAQAGQAAALSLRAMTETILCKEGAKAFFVGVTPRLVMKAPQLGIALLVVETLDALANPTPPCPA